MFIKVAEQIGRNAVTQRAGNQLFELIYGELKQNRKVTIDFSGVEVYSSPFFNNSIGRLFADIDGAIIRNFLEMTNLNSTGEEVVRRVVENARRYYALTKEDREKQDAVNREFFDNLDEQ